MEIREHYPPQRFRIVILLCLIGLLISASACYSNRAEEKIKAVEVGDRISEIEKDVMYQLECGPRLPGSSCHVLIEQYIVQRLIESSFSIEQQHFTYNNKGVNIIGKYGKGSTPIIIGAHYDTRFIADKDADVQNRNKPVPGANDGASGVALLLDLSRSISNSTELVTVPVWLVFFDLEDNGGFPGWEWIIGSTYFAQSLEIEPAMAVIVDMIGDKDLQLYYEVNSTPEIREEIWKVAEDLGFNDVFIPEEKYRILDDHIPFLERGIPAVDIIDFDYPYWHTTLDTYDKVSPDSIRIVSDVIFQWILRNDQLK